MAGRLNRRIDVDVLTALASHLSGASLFLIGPLAAGDRSSSLERLLGRANVHHISTRSRDELPAYLRHADVLLVPYVADEWSHYSSPMKIWEYLYAGKPIVGHGCPPLAELGEPIAYHAGHGHGGRGGGGARARRRRSRHRRGAPPCDRREQHVGDPGGRASLNRRRTPRSSRRMSSDSGTRERAPAVTVIIPVHGSHGGLTDTLDALSAQDYAGEVQVVVVDNGDNHDLPAARQRRRGRRGAGPQLLRGA